LQTYGGDHQQFLRDCRIEVCIGRLDEVNFERVYELAQRTNQLNFSGNRYPRHQLMEIMATDSVETYVIECRDRFGKYGVVGFAVVDCGAPRLQDLMFSCRVQGKRIEHAILCFLLRRFSAGEDRDFFASYRKTARNAAAGRVFEEIGFECLEERENAFALVFRRGRAIPDDGIVVITSSAAA
jgi:FkbH-like protein